MNLEEYFSRIQYSGTYSKADLVTLNQLHEQHLRFIPYENLSIHCGEKIVTDLEACYNKIVRKKRGGWCSENNSVFAWVLKKLGYDVTLLAACVYDIEKKAYSDRMSHMIIKVVINGNTYIADVGFSSSRQIRQPLELTSGKDQPQIPGVFRLTEESGVWYLDKISRKKSVHHQSFHGLPLLENNENSNRVVKIYRFTLEPYSTEQLQLNCIYLQTSPESLFTKKSICCLQTHDGVQTLVGWTYGEVTYKYEEDMDLITFKTLTDEEVKNTVKEKFGIVLEKKLVPANNAAHILV
ncbi:arylamine N-acetyltransferase, pineal gland isozyme NAT-10-like [Protopterus annectens]|uniref:arylamine N-acetyltransferase, pineal gland isozyme NAT-10-like n=1 Tax=Protopterus annectens TaxID=7888 RepID=UPI001CFA51A8|nr:arylamine N-acetyltransferase, pineal gland isozyme NAT-10-like [Protopterus annectens]